MADWSITTKPTIRINHESGQCTVSLSWPRWFTQDSGGYTYEYELPATKVYYVGYYVPGESLGSCAHPNEFYVVSRSSVNIGNIVIETVNFNLTYSDVHLDTTGAWHLTSLPAVFKLFVGGSAKKYIDGEYNGTTWKAVGYSSFDVLRPSVLSVQKQKNNCTYNYIDNFDDATTGIKISDSGVFLINVDIVELYSWARDNNSLDSFRLALRNSSGQVMAGWLFNTLAVSGTSYDTGPSKVSALKHYQDSYNVQHSPFWVTSPYGSLLAWNAQMAESATSCYFTVDSTWPSGYVDSWVPLVQTTQIPIRTLVFPTNFRVTATTATTVDLAWDQLVEDQPEQYKIMIDSGTYSVGTGTWSNHTEVTEIATARTSVVTGLSPETEYHFTLRAYSGETYLATTEVVVTTDIELPQAIGMITSVGETVVEATFSCVDQRCVRIGIAVDTDTDIAEIINTQDNLSYLKAGITAGTHHSLMFRPVFEIIGKPDYVYGDWQYLYFTTKPDNLININYETYLVDSRTDLEKPVLKLLFGSDQTITGADIYYLSPDGPKIIAENAPSGFILDSYATVNLRGAYPYIFQLFPRNATGVSSQSFLLNAHTNPTTPKNFRQNYDLSRTPLDMPSTIYLEWDQPFSNEELESYSIYYITAATFGTEDSEFQKITIGANNITGPFLLELVADAPNTKYLAYIEVSSNGGKHKATSEIIEIHSLFTGPRLKSWSSTTSSISVVIDTDVPPQIKIVSPDNLFETFVVMTGQGTDRTTEFTITGLNPLQVCNLSLQFIDEADRTYFSAKVNYLTYTQCPMPVNLVQSGVRQRRTADISWDYFDVDGIEVQILDMPGTQLIADTEFISQIIGGQITARVIGLLPSKNYSLRIRAHAKPSQFLPDISYSEWTPIITVFTAIEVPPLFVSNLTRVSFDLNWMEAVNLTEFRFTIASSTEDGYTFSATAIEVYDSMKHAFTGLRRGTLYTIKYVVLAASGELSNEMFIDVTTDGLPYIENVFICSGMSGTHLKIKGRNFIETFKVFIDNIEQRIIEYNDNGIDVWTDGVFLNKELYVSTDGGNTNRVLISTGQAPLISWCNSRMRIGGRNYRVDGRYFGDAIVAAVEIGAVNIPISSVSLIGTSVYLDLSDETLTPAKGKLTVSNNYGSDITAEDIELYRVMFTNLEIADFAAGTELSFTGMNLNDISHVSLDFNGNIFLPEYSHIGNDEIVISTPTDAQSIQLAEPEVIIKLNVIDYTHGNQYFQTLPAKMVFAPKIIVIENERIFTSGDEVTIHVYRQPSVQTHLYLDGVEQEILEWGSGFIKFKVGAYSVSSNEHFITLVSILGTSSNEFKIRLKSAPVITAVNPNDIDIGNDFVVYGADIFNGASVNKQPASLKFRTGSLMHSMEYRDIPINFYMAYTEYSGREVFYVNCKSPLDTPEGAGQLVLTTEMGECTYPVTMSSIAPEITEPTVHASRVDEEILILGNRFTDNFGQPLSVWATDPDTQEEKEIAIVPDSTTEGSVKIILTSDYVGDTQIRVKRGERWSNYWLINVSIVLPTITAPTPILWPVDKLMTVVGESFRDHGVLYWGNTIIPTTAWFGKYINATFPIKGTNNLKVVNESGESNLYPLQIVAPVPVITNLSKYITGVNRVIKIFGDDFTSNGSVFIDGTIPVRVLDYDNNTIRIGIPEVTEDTTHVLTVTNKYGEVSNEISFYVSADLRADFLNEDESGDCEGAGGDGDLILLYLTPSKVKPGQVVTAYGQGFGTRIVASNILIDNVNCKVVTWDNNKITFEVPFVEDGPHQVKVKVGRKTSNALQIIIDNKAIPEITIYVPKVGCSDHIIVRGKNFWENTGSKLGSARPDGCLLIYGKSPDLENVTELIIEVWSKTLIVARLKKENIIKIGATGWIAVKTPTGTSEPKKFEILPPYIASSNQHAVKRGERFNIYGIRFCDQEFITSTPLTILEANQRSMAVSTEVKDIKIETVVGPSNTITIKLEE